MPSKQCGVPATGWPIILRWRSSAAYRIAFAYTGAYAICLIALGGAVLLVMHFALIARIDSTLSDEAHTLTAQYAFGGNHELGDAITDRQTTWSSTRMLYGVYAPDGRRIMGSFAAPRQPLGFGNPAFYDPHDRQQETARALSVDLEPGKRLVVAADLDSIAPIQKTVLTVLGFALAGIIFLGLLGAMLLGSYLRLRLSSINQSAQAIIGGDISQRVPVGLRGDEFDQLGATLNRMLDRIENLLDNLKQVSSDIAHDLRTPLSRLRTRLEHGVADCEHGTAPLIHEAIERVDNLLSLFAAILRIAEVESGETKRLFKLVNLSVLVAQLSESFTPSVEDQDRTLLSSIEPGIMVNGDRELIAQAIINLLENSQRHTLPGAIIRLTLVRTGPFACVAVVDNGKGVPPSQLHRITRRFTRLETDRNTPGHGLGLSLVKAVAGLHGGRLVLRNVEPGLSAVLEIPIVNVINVAPGALKRSEEGSDLPQIEVE